MLARLGRSAADRERALAATRRFAADAGHELRTPLTSVQATLSTLERHLDLPARAPRRDARRRAGRAGPPRRRCWTACRRSRAATRGRSSSPRSTWPRWSTPPRPPRASAIPACGCTPTCPMRPSRCGAGSPGCGCWPTTWWRTPPATAAPGGRIRVTLEPHAGRGRRRAADRRRRRARASPTPTGRGSSSPSRAWKPPTATGSGLGLALVEQQVRHHGARIEVGESPLGGARFSVRFAARAQ